MTPVPAEAAAVAYARDLWVCTCCGTPVAGRPHSARRRNPRGGDGPANLLTFLGDGTRPGDPGDHRAAVDSGLNVFEEAFGWTLHGRRDPLAVPVTACTAPWSAGTYWLDNAGSRLTEAPEGIAA